MFPQKKQLGNKQMVPTRAWAMVLGMALLVAGILAYPRLSINKPFRNWRELQYANYKVRLDNLKRQQPPQPDEYRVLVFGSSLTEHGVLADKFFNERFRASGLSVKVNRVFYAGVNYKMLEDEDLIAFLEYLQPDLLCLEDQVFMYTPRSDLDWPEPLTTRWHKNYVFNLNVLKHQLLPAIFPEPGIDARIDSTGTFDIPHPRADSVIGEQDSTVYKLEPRSIRQWKQTPQFNQCLERLSAKGTKVVLLHLPRPGTVEKQYLSKRMIRRKEQLIEAYRQTFDLDLWQYDQPMPFKYYWDLGHMNQYGQAVYSEWLFEKIKEQTSDLGVDLLKKEDKAVLVGKTTAGAMLSGATFSISKKLAVFLPVADYLTAAGERIDKVGVSPHYEMPTGEAYEFVLRELIGN